MTLDELKEQPPTVLDALPIRIVKALLDEANMRAAQCAQMQAILHQSLVARFARGLNDTGTTHRDVDGVRVTIIVPKRVKWDQVKLAILADELAAVNENPTEYIDVKLDVQERRYTAWPQSLRDRFEAARTVDMGKPKIELSVMQMEAA